MSKTRKNRARWLTLVLSVIMLGLSSFGARADLAGDKKICRLGDDKVDRLGACTRLIDSGALSPDDLKKAYETRAEVYQTLSSRPEADEDLARDERTNRVYFLTRKGRYEEAIAASYPEMIRAFARELTTPGKPNLFNTHYSGDYSELMLLSYYRGHRDDALKYYELAVSLDSTYPRISEYRCKGLAFLGDLRDALKECNASIDNPRFGQDQIFGHPMFGHDAPTENNRTVDFAALVTRGIVKLRLGDLDGAAADFDDIRYHSNWLPPAAIYGRGIVRRMRADRAAGDEDIARAKAIDANVGGDFAFLGISDPGAAPVPIVAKNRPRALINADVYLKNARFIEYADHGCRAMWHAANFYFNAAGSYLQAGELGRIGPLVRKGSEIIKRTREIWEVLRDLNNYGNTQARYDSIKECVNDVPDFFATPEPESCQLIADYEKLGIMLERFPERTTRSDVISPIAAKKLASLGCGPAPPPKQREVQTFRDCPSICPEMVVIPAGEFVMGAPDTDPNRGMDEGQHKVVFSKPFAVGKFAVTFDEWKACAAAGGCKSNKSPDDEKYGRGRRPVIHVSWNDAKEYVAWLSRKTGKPYRLLSDSEWEYAGRGGSTTIYPWGDAIGIGNANCEACGSDFKATAPVGSYKPNGFGLYDMVGNVVQWVEDRVHNSSYVDAPADGSVWQGDIDLRVIRGGSWRSSSAIGLRVARRNSFPPTYQNTVIGFRVARSM